MFRIFQAHSQPGTVLVFTAGVEAGEVWSDNGGEMLYHASLDAAEYHQLLSQHGFEVLSHVVRDPDCGGATVWMARSL